MMVLFHETIGNYVHKIGLNMSWNIFMSGNEIEN